jgi:hypothetical protein
LRQAFYLFILFVSAPHAESRLFKNAFSSSFDKKVGMEVVCVDDGKKFLLSEKR